MSLGITCGDDLGQPIPNVSYRLFFLVSLAGWLWMVMDGLGDLRSFRVRRF